MKQVLVAVLLFVFFKQALSQNIIDHEFLGTLQLSSQQLITYKINFRHFPDNHIEGYSVTDIYGEDRTKSVIRGTFDSISGKLSFYETANVSTKSTANADEFCYIKVTGGKIKRIRGKKIIQCEFTGSFVNGKSCAKGQLYLIGSDYLYNLGNQVLNSKSVAKDTSGVVRKKYNALRDGVENYQINGSDKLLLNWTSKEVVLEVWDGNSEDRDEIEVYMNNKKIVDRITIKQEKKMFIVPFEGEICEIRIVGISEGTLPPCTVNLLLRDGINSTSLIAKLKKGESSIIRLKSFKETH